MKVLQESTLGIVGLGLMGGSLALALRARNACRRIIGVTRNAGTRRRRLSAEWWMRSATSWAYSRKRT